MGRYPRDNWEPHSHLVGPGTVNRWQELVDENADLRSQLAAVATKAENLNQSLAFRELQVGRERARVKELEALLEQANIERRHWKAWCKKAEEGKRMKKTFEIEWPDDCGPGWMNVDNLMLCINAYCSNEDGRIKAVEVDPVSKNEEE